MRSRTWPVVLAAVTSSAVWASTASAAPSFAPDGQAAIQPGAQTITDGGQCTSNFVFTDAADNVYLGQAAHCAGTGPSGSNGCEAGSRPLGTQVEIEGASRPGTLAYSSWLQMQAVGETDPNACQFNDFALVKVDEADESRVNPSVPGFGGPMGITPTVSAGATVFSFGTSSARGGIDLLKPKRGFSLGQSAGGWTHDVLTITPGIPGDSGSAFFDRQGRAFGVLSTLQLAPAAGTNGVSDLNLMLNYANDKSDLDVSLVDGTRPMARSFLGTGL